MCLSACFDRQGAPGGVSSTVMQQSTDLLRTSGNGLWFPVIVMTSAVAVRDSAVWT